MLQLYSADQVQAMDRYAIEQLDIPAITLMSRAGKAAFKAVLQNWPEVSEIHVFAGHGNNGGDGYVLAALAAQRGIVAAVWRVDALDQSLSQAAQNARDYAIQEGATFHNWNQEAWQAYAFGDKAVIVDALLGTGIRGPVKAPYLSLIQAINASQLPVLSLDIPSGVDASTGVIANEAVQADFTISFITQKIGNRIGAGRLASRVCSIDSLGVPDTCIDHAGEGIKVLNLSSPYLPSLSERSEDAHKGNFGHLLVLGGDYGYGGAALMAAASAVRCGTGLVSVATRAEHVGAMIAHQPELMVKAIASGQELLALLDKPTVLALGPGLGRSAWSEQLFYHSVHSHQPLVLDADGLQLLANSRLQVNERSSAWVLTPHPGEAASLLGISIEEVLSDRLQAVRALNDRFGATVVLKGSGTLVMTSKQKLYLCEAGNPGMASGGMGDVLTGVIAALIAQGLSADQAACLGVTVHAAAADQLAQDNGQRGLLATDLIPMIRHLINRDNSFSHNNLTQEKPSKVVQ